MKFLDFFSGIGGFRLGMEMAGHECVGHCEIDKYADISYRAMHKVKENEFYANDITRIEPGDLPQADVYCGGFPCQAFSIAGNRGGFADTRGTLFFEVMRLAVVRKPKYLFLENVKGLLSHDNGKTFGTILRALWECGYDAEWQVCNSKYWVPQNRERIFIIGHIRGQSAGQVFPITEVSGKTNDIQGPITNTITARYGTAESGGAYIIESQLDAQKNGVIQINNAQEFGSVPRQQNRIYNTKWISPALTKGFSDTVNIVEPKINQVGMMTGGKWDKMNDQPRRVYGTDGISPSLHTCGGGNLEPKIAISAPTIRARQGLEVHQNLTIRKLTPRECFRLQGFPDEYFDKAASVNSDSQLYKQAGNSVTVPVIHEIARRLK